MKPPVLISVVSRSPLAGWNIAPRIISPHRNMLATDTSSSAPRPGRLRRKWPPPGMSQPNASAGAQALSGGIGCRCSFSFTISLSLAGDRDPLGLQDFAPDHLVRLDLVPKILAGPDEYSHIKLQSGGI